MSTKNICSKCHKMIVKDDNSFATGYGLDSKRNKICYDCCAIDDKKFMDDTGKITLYLTKKDNGKFEVTNWPGSLRFNVYGMSTGRHNIAGKRYDVTFYDHNGNAWYGTQYGDNTQLCHCKRYKDQ